MIAYYHSYLYHRNASEGELQPKRKASAKCTAGGASSLTQCIAKAKKIVTSVLCAVLSQNEIKAVKQRKRLR